MKNTTRRRFVIQSSRIIAFIPLAGIISCKLDTSAVLTAEECFKRLICMLGPWDIEQQALAEDFAERYLKSNHAQKYLPKAVKLVESLSNHILEEAMDVDEIDLDNIPEEEQETLLNLTKELYSFVEIRFYVAKEQPWGQCQGDSKWHTKIPD